MLQTLGVNFPSLQLHAFIQSLRSLEQLLNDFWLMPLKIACRGLALLVKLKMSLACESIQLQATSCKAGRCMLLDAAHHQSLVALHRRSHAVNIAHK